MKRTTIQIFLLILTAVIARQASAEALRFKSIAFKGLKNITKEEIIRQAGIRIEGSDMLIDSDRLERVLSKTAVIKSYSLNHIQESLVITITEKEPVIVLSLESSKETIVCELDDTLSVISYNRIYDTRLPVLHLKSHGAKDFELSGDVRKFCAMMIKIKNRHEALYAEINDIDYGRGQSVIHLHRRRTQFIVGNSIDNFIRLKYISGYLDRVRRYPETVHVLSEKVLIEQGA